MQRDNGQTVEAEFAIEEIAELSEWEYEQRRKELAGTLAVTVAGLDRERKRRRARAEPPPAEEPWPEDVSGAALVAEIVGIIEDHAVVADGAAEACAAFVLHTYTIDAVQVSPILEITSPIMRCGKTTLARALKRLCRHAIMASNISPAALYRIVDAQQPTLVIDEGDTFLRLSEEMRGILNAGHMREGAFVIKCDGDDNEPRIFSTWAAKVLALIDRPPATVQDRAITVHMERKPTERSVKRLPPRDTFGPIRQRCARWAKDHIEELREWEPEIPEGLNDRERDNWEPLLAIGEVVGGEFARRLRHVAQTLSGADEEDNLRTMLLEDLRKVFDEAGVDALSSQKIIDDLVVREGRPWPEFRKGRPLTANQLAKQLKSFRIKPKQIWLDGANRRGYERKQFEDVWSLYLTSPADPPIQGARPLDASVEAGYSPKQSVRDNDGLAAENRLNANESAGSSTLAVRKGVSGGDIGEMPDFLRRQRPDDGLEPADAEERAALMDEGTH